MDSLEYIVAVSLNSAITRVLTIPNFTIGNTHAIENQEVITSSKAINAARLLVRFDRSVYVVGIAGRVTGVDYPKLLKEEKIPSDLILLEEEVRSTYEIIDPVQKTATLVVDQGPVVSRRALNAFMNTLERNLQKSRLVILAGSLPQVIPDDLYAAIMQKAHNLPRTDFIVDCRGKPLFYALQERPLLVRINLAEAEGFLGDSFTGAQGALKAARRICEQGAKWTCISLGEKGAVFSSAEEGFISSHPPIEVASPIGSGDAMLAGLAMAILDGETPQGMLRFAAACGVANAISYVPCRISPADVSEALSKVTIERVHY